MLLVLGDDKHLAAAVLAGPEPLRTGRGVRCRPVAAREEGAARVAATDVVALADTRVAREQACVRPRQMGAVGIGSESGAGVETSEREIGRLRRTASRESLVVAEPLG